MNFEWTIKPIPAPLIIEKLQSDLQLDSVISTLLSQRGVTTFEQAKSYFRPNIDDLHDPFEMLNMDAAVQRFNKAITSKEKIVIYGDYDVDGTMSVSLFLNAFPFNKENITFYIPDRFSEGYGVNAQAVRKFSEDGISLIITLDCGIKSVSEIALAKELGLDVIICDHHEPGDLLPNALILNPKQQKCTYPYKDLCGCGVTFKFLQAFYQSQNLPSEKLYPFLDLVVVATAADIVSITGENRLFCYFGLNIINEKLPHKTTAISKLLKTANKTNNIVLSDLVFTIAPRINAAGRILHANEIVNLFVSNDSSFVETQIELLNVLNSERRELDQQTTNEALSEINQEASLYSNIVYNENWSKGVVGIVASKLVEKNHRPSIVLTKSNDKITGSGRSIPNLNLYDLLSKSEMYLDQFGGHAFACGMSLNEEKLPEFKEHFDKLVEEQFKKNPTLFLPKIDIDVEIDFKNIYTQIDQKNPNRLPKFVRILNQMEPFGPNNMRPVFITRNVIISDYKILKDVHYKFDLQHGQERIRIDGIAFNFKEKMEAINTNLPVEIVYTIGVNYWNQKENVQLEIKDIRNSIY